MKTVIYIGNFKAGIMDAQTQLIIGNCRILEELGYQPVLIGNDPTLANPQDIFPSENQIQGYPCFNISFSKGVRDLVKARRIHSQIQRVLNRYADGLHAVICYGSPAFGIELYFLKNWCRRHGVRFLANVVDLSATNHGTPIQKFIKTLDRRIIEGTIIKNADGIIAVSEYIDRFYRKHTSVPTVILPPLKDTREILPPNCPENDITRIVYIGVPFPLDGRKMEEDAYKDRIDLFIDLLCSIRDRVPPFRLDLYGLTREQYLNTVTRHTALLEAHGDILHFHGRISHEESLKCFAEADFSVLFRVKNRMTMAGFSSKLVESISCGTPVILTDTSDCLSYLRDGETCFLLDPEDPDASRERLTEVLNLPRQDIWQKKQQCYASRIFDYRNYIEKMDHFLRQLQDNTPEN